MECPICYDLISNSCYGNCNHHYCYKCFKKWCLMGGDKCPMCKEIIYQIILDKEFDLNNNPTNKEEIKKELTETIYVKFENKLKPGIKIAERVNLYNKETFGVIVKKLEKNKVLINYLQENDIIMYLNGVPCINAKNTIEIIKKYFNNNDILKIEILPRINKKKSYNYGCMECMELLFKNR